MSKRDLYEEIKEGIEAWGAREDAIDLAKKESIPSSISGRISYYVSGVFSYILGLTLTFGLIVLIAKMLN